MVARSVEGESSLGVVLATGPPVSKPISQREARIRVPRDAYPVWAEALGEQPRTIPFGECSDATEFVCGDVVVRRSIGDRQ